MIARNENVKVLYREEVGGNAEKKLVPVAAILNGGRPPIVYRLTTLQSDELANMFESGNPDEEIAILSKGQHVA